MKARTVTNLDTSADRSFFLTFTVGLIEKCGLLYIYAPILKLNSEERNRVQWHNSWHNDAFPQLERWWKLTALCVFFPPPTCRLILSMAVSMNIFAVVTFADIIISLSTATHWEWMAGVTLLSTGSNPGGRHWVYTGYSLFWVQIKRTNGASAIFLADICF